MRLTRSHASLRTARHLPGFREGFRTALRSRLVHSTHFFYKSLRDFSRHGSPERTKFSTRDYSLRLHLNHAEHVLGQEIVTQFKNDVGVGLVACDAKTELLELRTL